MKKLLAAVIIVSLFSISVLAQDNMSKQDKKEMKQSKEMKESKSMASTLKGYLVDKMCGAGYAKGDAAKAAEKGMKHSKACALDEDCAASGFGIVMDGKYLKFDEAGDKLALEYLNKSEKKSDFLVEVAGTQDGNMVKVKSLSELNTTMKQDKKK
ncbi:MAG TPA: hypothetical protein VII11_02365 [Bacteroidota bacterium]